MVENKISTRKMGNIGEERAVSFLLKNGYQIVDRNYYIRGGEIDIVALYGEFIVFVEVKYLPHGNVDILQSELNRKKIKNIIKTSKCYLEKHREYSNRYIRFDVLAIDVPGLDTEYHIVNAFSE